MSAGFCTDCGGYFATLKHQLCQKCFDVSLDIEDGESPCYLLDGRWVVGRHGIRKWVAA